MSDEVNDQTPATPPDPQASAPSGDEFEIDISAFLPEGTEMTDESVEEPDQSTSDTGPGQSQPDQEVDTTVLAAIEADLAEVDDAIAAIDSGDLARSRLISELTAEGD